MKSLSNSTKRFIVPGIDAGDIDRGPPHPSVTPTVEADILG